MGIYNTLIVESVCPCCGGRATLKIQFRYGEVWDYTYFIDDEIRWGSENTGVPGEKMVVLDGVAEACELCDESSDYLIFLENDLIKYVRQNQGEYRFFDTDGFLVLEP